METPASAIALLLVDVINDFDFPAADLLLEHALPAAPRIAALKRRLKGRGCPVIYVNDNFGRWRSDFQQQIARCTAEDCKGREIARQVLPEDDDFFVLKPKHSGFYSTALEVLLEHLEIRTLVLAGFAGDICVLYTANDAYMRNFQLIVAADCVASETAEGNAAALEHMEKRLKAQVVRSAAILS